MCRSRRELSNEYSLAKFGLDTAENEPILILINFSSLQRFNFDRAPASPGGREDRQELPGLLQPGGAAVRIPLQHAAYRLHLSFFELRVRADFLLTLTF